jgi:uncharacterized protein (TIGR03118 family)
MRMLISLGVTAALALVAAKPAAAQYYGQQNLVSDGAVPAAVTNAHLVNAWGLAASPTSPWWISDNGSGNASVYNSGTMAVSAFAVPGAGGAAGVPTGMVFNGGSGFMVPNAAGTLVAARFIIAGEDGTIAAFRAGAIVVVIDNSASGAVYKGLAIDSTSAGQFIYATNFRAARVDVFDSHYAPVHNAGAFVDHDLPAGYAPFGIQTINGTVYVTYALQDAARHDDVAGQGHGYIDAYDTAGHFLHRVASKGQLNSPWGLALAPSTFGAFSDALIVGNFGDGRIFAFDPTRVNSWGEFDKLGPLLSAKGPPLMIDGLWGLAFGNGGTANGPTNTLFFTAGPDGESHGLFGALTVAPSPAD